MLPVEAVDSVVEVADLRTNGAAVAPDPLPSEAVAAVPKGGAAVVDLPETTDRTRVERTASVVVAAEGSQPEAAKARRDAVVVAAAAAAVDPHQFDDGSRRRRRVVVEVPDSDRIRVVVALSVLLHHREAAEQNRVAPTCAFSEPCQCSR